MPIDGFGWHFSLQWTWNKSIQLHSEEVSISRLEHSCILYEGRRSERYRQIDLQRAWSVAHFMLLSCFYSPPKPIYTSIRTLFDLSTWFMSVRFLARKKWYERLFDIRIRSRQHATGTLPVEVCDLAAFLAYFNGWHFVIACCLYRIETSHRSSIHRDGANLTASSFFISANGWHLSNADTLTLVQKWLRWTQPVYQSYISGELVKHALLADLNMV